MAAARPCPWSSSPAAQVRAAAVLLLALCPGADCRAADEWKFDVVHLKTGKSLQGLLVQQLPEEIVLKCVHRKPGSATVVIRDIVPRREIARIELLQDEDRRLLATRLEKLAREADIEQYLRQVLDPAAQDEPSPLKDLELRPAPWGNDGRGRAQSYTATHFRLVSNAGRRVVERAAFHLEQIYGAYARLLPPRLAAGEPTTIFLPQSVADYQALLRQQDRRLHHLAFYDPARNEIVCACDLPRICDSLAEVRRKHDQMRKQLQDQEAELKRLYKNNVPESLAKPIKDAREKINQTEAQNLKDAEAAAHRLLQMLYHEAFHAYLAAFVYPAAEGQVPRWLNEGLAQVFEGAAVEGGELRVDRPDAGRLARAQVLLRKRELVGLTDLLRSGPKEFLVVHGSERQTSDRHYLTSWAVAHYLAFDRKILGSKALDEYVRALHRGADPLAAFHDLVGQTPGQFEEGFHRYLGQLRPNGRAPRP